MLNIILTLQAEYRARVAQGQPVGYMDAIHDLVDAFMTALVNRFIEDNQDTISESVQRSMEESYAEEGKDLDNVMDDPKRAETEREIGYNLFQDKYSVDEKGAMGDILQKLERVEMALDGTKAWAE